MKLLTKAIALRFPRIYATDGQPEEERPIVAKFFTPWSASTWFAVEADALIQIEPAVWIPLAEAVAKGMPYRDVKFYGLAYIHEAELGYWLLSDFAEVYGPGGLRIERDLHYTGTLADARRQVPSR